MKVVKAQHFLIWSDDNTVIYYSSTLKQCLQLLTFLHSSSCNAYSAIQQMSEKRTDSGCSSCSWLSKSADGATKQTVSSSAVFSIHVQCVSEMFTEASICSRDCQEKSTQFPYHIPEPVTIAMHLFTHIRNQTSWYQSGVGKKSLELHCYEAMKPHCHSVVWPQRYSVP